MGTRYEKGTRRLDICFQSNRQLRRRDDNRCLGCHRHSFVRRWGAVAALAVQQSCKERIDIEGIRSRFSFRQALGIAVVIALHLFIKLLRPVH